MALSWKNDFMEYLATRLINSFSIANIVIILDDCTRAVDNHPVALPLSSVVPVIIQKEDHQKRQDFEEKDFRENLKRTVKDRGDCLDFEKSVFEQQTIVDTGIECDRQVLVMQKLVRNFHFLRCNTVLSSPTFTPNQCLLPAMFLMTLERASCDIELL
ncbi:hypothetical protein MG293_003246 [Ovis ammon polii]|uniref:Uncharacterized protein n=1 Tax=Ovis ammon polii TaxID=230172 RepID=A0AAD4UK33_OVIAM|nr:hypothetical protein MG293_003246 [Ovis ammon polii]